MGTPRWRRGLNRIGFVGWLLAALLLGSLLAIIWMRVQQHRTEQARMALTAYRSGSIQDRRWLPYLEALPPGRILAPDGLRFIASAELQRNVYALALTLQPGWPTANGILIVDESWPQPKPRARYTCQMPAAGYRALTAALDKQLDGFAGSPDFVTDGTSYAFERIRGDRVTSGSGNAITAYHQAGDLILRYTRAACSFTRLPEPGSEWYLSER
ncbi:hypothetical protein [Sphingomonas sp.]|uniref:hypothetical protein n=1 Tax=Sphingomonas sp. TaxID=28214 RepID=UPI0035C7CEAA